MASGGSSSSLGIKDVTTIFWLALSGWIHIVLEGTFSWNNRIINEAGDLPSEISSASHYVQSIFSSTTVPPSSPNDLPVADNLLEAIQRLLIAIWKEYGCGDSRYVYSDSFVVSMESVTASVAGPLCFLLIYLILTRKPQRYFVQVVLCMMQLYGLVLYWMTEHLENYSHVEVSDFKCYYFYYWFFNAIWFVIPLYLLTDAGLSITDGMTRSMAATGQQSRRKNVIVFVAESFVLGTVLGAALIVFGLVVGLWFDEALRSNLH